MSNRSEERKRLLKAAIDACKDSDDNVQKRRVVEAAKDENNPLHGEFEWDVNAAAETAWLARAGELIREFRDIVVYRGEQIAYPTYVPHPRAVDGGYARTAAIANNAELKRLSLDAELERIGNAIRRALSLAVAFDMEPQFQKLLKDVVKLKGTLAGS